MAELLRIGSSVATPLGLAGLVAVLVAAHLNQLGILDFVRVVVKSVGRGKRRSAISVTQ